MKPIFFTVGPTQTHKNFEKHMMLVLRQDIASMSHRSKTFHQLYEKVDKSLKSIWKIPKDYKILFFSSATEVWDRLAQNCVDTESLHFINGKFGEKHAQTIESYGKKSTRIENQLIDTDLIKSTLSARKKYCEYIAFTHNESSTGVSVPIQAIHAVKKISPNTLVVVDAVSSAPLPKFDFKVIDGVYFSVQKCLGLPAGLAVLVASPELIEKSIKIKKEKSITGYYRSFDTMMKSYSLWETYETPNVLGIFLLSKTLDDMAREGVTSIRNSVKQNAKSIYDFFDIHPYVKPAVKDKRFRSDTVIVLDTGIKTDLIKKRLAKEGLIVGSGYGDHKKDQIRIACFPQHAKHIIKLLSSEAWKT